MSMATRTMVMRMETMGTATGVTGTPTVMGTLTAPEEEA